MDGPEPNRRVIDFFQPLIWLITAGGLIHHVCPGLYWGEGPVLALAGGQLGISHPPGYPLHSLLAHGAQLLPLGDRIGRTGWLTTLLGATAGLLVYRLVTSWTGRRPAGACAWLCYMTAGPIVSACLTTEVYSLNLVLLLGVLSLALPEPDQGDHRRWIALVFLLGLGGGNHLTLGLLTPLLLLVVGLGRWDRLNRRVLSAAFLAGLLGISILLYHPLRSTFGAGLDWGSPDRWDRFLILITAAEEALPSVGAGPSGPIPWLLAFGAILRKMATGMGLPASLLALVGLACCFQRRRLLVLPAGVALLGAAVAGYHTHEVDSFLTPGFAMLALMAGLGCSVCLELARTTWLRRGLGTVLVMILGLQAWQSLEARSLRGVRVPREYGSSILNSLPERSLVVTRRSDLSFLLWYLQRSEGYQSEPVVIFRHLLAYPWYYRQLVQQDPDGSWVQVAPELFEDSQAWVEFLTETLALRNLEDRWVFLAEPEDYFGFLRGTPPRLFLRPWTYVHRLTRDPTDESQRLIPPDPGGPIDPLSRGILLRNRQESRRVLRDGGPPSPEVAP